MSDAEQITLFRVRTLAARWDTSAKTIRRMIWSGELKAVRVGKAATSIRIPLAEVERYEASRPAA